MSNDCDTAAENVNPMRKLFILPCTAFGALASLAMATGAMASEIASPWVEGHNSRARLVGGASVAGVELQLPEGWKTYWRTPGDAGGVPPSFDWSGSENLASAQVLYPAPKRFTDRSGDTLGYKGNLTFPVRLTAKDPAKPIDLHLLVDYGVCKDICIPAQAALELTLPPDTAMPEALIEAMTKVPAPPEARRESDPQLKRTVAELTGANPHIVLEAEIPGGAEHVDAFVEAPDGLYVPLPKKTADDGKGNVTFEVELGKDVDLGALKGKQLTATIVSDKGQSEATFPLQ
ncbi:MAG: protein-disulfide reductase DsbD domain-containing protein [Hyphomicrobium sp.]|jgi:DsbC/DsbD-like thiol-disulfide interchange protein